MNKEREKRVEIGAKVAPTTNIMIIDDGYVDGEKYTGYVGAYMMGAVGATFTYYLSKRATNGWFLHGCLDYSLRGANISNFSSENVKAKFRMDYFGIEVGIGVRGRVMYWIPSVRMGVLTRANFQREGSKWKIKDECNPVIVEEVEHFGFCIGDHIDLGFHLAYIPTNMIKPKFWTGKSSSWGVNVGVEFTYRFKIK